MGSIELEGRFVLALRVFRESALREEVSEVVPQIGGVGLRVHAPLLLDDAIVERVAGDEVFPVEGLGGLFVSGVDQGTPGAGRCENDRERDFLHWTSSGNGKR
jgi:hypothetical protein